MFWRNFRKMESINEKRNLRRRMVRFPMPEAKPRVDEVVAGKKDVKEVINIPPPPEDKADADQIVKAVVKKDLCIINSGTKDIKP